jgi:hypothetical protein
MFYVWRVNFALARLGVNPRRLNTDWRRGLQLIGMSAGYSPQEIAVYIASELPLRMKIDLDPNVARAWVLKGKIDPNRSDVFGALVELGWFDFVREP